MGGYEYCVIVVLALSFSDSGGVVGGIECEGVILERFDGGRFAGCVALGVSPCWVSRFASGPYFHSRRAFRNDSNLSFRAV